MTQTHLQGAAEKEFNRLNAHPPFCAFLSPYLSLCLCRGSSLGALDAALCLSPLGCPHLGLGVSFLGLYHGHGFSPCLLFCVCPGEIQAAGLCKGGTVERAQRKDCRTDV